MTTVFEACGDIIIQLTDPATKKTGDEFVIPFAEGVKPEHFQAVAEALKIVFANSNAGAASVLVKDNALRVIPNSAIVQGVRARGLMDRSLGHLMKDVAYGWSAVSGDDGDELVKWPLSHEQGLPALLREFTTVRNKGGDVPLITIPVDSLDPMLAALGAGLGRQVG